MIPKPLQLLVLVVTVTETVVLVSGIQCYNCDSKSHRNVCGADFKLTSSNTTFIVDDCHFCNKYHFSNDGVYIRNCTKKTPGTIQFKFGCEEAKVNRTTVETCSCSDNLCNGAIPRLAALPSVIIVCLSVFYSLEPNFKLRI
ncbi:uncharacterized protein LOC128546677 [Mercenaria mercenaria]|uniref:uncharacterized protein LOC128546677 n=1 Tax=Mercenaria mercenaria TaxID=6596 RepID=UPI00234E8B06|nr:uncharacterized protein LOC128546677 [Mercenaria mercenaria]